MAMVLFSMALFLEKKLKLLCKLQQNEPTIIGMYLNLTLSVKSDLYNYILLSKHLHVVKVEWTTFLPHLASRRSATLGLHSFVIVYLYLQ